MKTILIIANNYDDANAEKKSLRDIYGFDETEYQIEIIGGNGEENRSIISSSSDYLSSLSNKINECIDNKRPVTAILLDIFLTQEEEVTLSKGYGYKASTSNKILKEYGDCAKNGTGAKINFVIISHFPQYLEYAKELSGNEDWSLYYYGKMMFNDPQIDDLYKQDIIAILKGEKKER